MKLKLTILLAITISTTLIISGCSTSCPEIGNKAPDFTLPTVEGENLSLNEFEGNIIMLNFWATWCGPCKAEMPHFQDVYNDRSNQGLVLLSIDIGENVSTVKTFVDNEGLTFPVLLDSQAKVAEQYCLPQALPQTLFIDKEGIIRARKIGAFRDKSEIESLLDSL